MRTLGLRRLYGGTFLRRTYRRPISPERYPMATLARTLSLYWSVPCLSSVLINFVAQFRTIPRGRSFIQVRKARAGPFRPSFRRMGLHGVSSTSFIPVLVVVSITTSYRLSQATSDNLASGRPSKCTPRCCVFQRILMYSVSYTWSYDCLPSLSSIFYSLHRTSTPRFLVVFSCILYITPQCHP